MQFRTCKICKENLKLTKNFYVCNTINGKKYYRKECKSCTSSKQTEISRKKAQWFKSYKKKLSCNRCNFNDHRALQFHHVRGEKVKAISVMVRDNHSKEKILKEIEKCEVLCANCHSIEHY